MTKTSLTGNPVGGLNVSFLSHQKNHPHLVAKYKKTYIKFKIFQMVRNLIPKMFRYGACDWEMNNSEMILFDLNMSYFSTTE